MNKWDCAVLIEPKQRIVDRARDVYRNRARGLFPCAPGSRGGRGGYAHLRLDAAMRREPRRDAAGRAAESGLSGAEAHDPVASGGVFVLAGTRGTTKGAAPATPKAASRRPSRSPNRAAGSCPPACCFGEGTFCRHLPMCLVATAATRMMSDVLASRRTSPAIESMPEIPRGRYAIGYNGQLITTEPVRKMNEAHGAFGIRCPDTIRLPVVG